MAEETKTETKTSVSGEENVDTDANNYIEAIKEMKKNSVAKEQYDKLLAENKQLLDAMINGVELPATPVEKPKVDVNELRKKLFSPDSDLSNIEYAKCAVELRDALIEQEGYDCFAPSGTNYQMTPEDITGPQKLADALKSAIEYADGDSALFTQELMRVTKNDSPLKAAIARR